MPGSLDFLVVSIGGTGDTYPILAAAIELKKRGHRVRFVGNARFEPLAASFELEFIPYHRPDLIMDPPVSSRTLRKVRSVVTHSWVYQSLSRGGRRKRAYTGAMRWLYDLIATQPDPRQTIVVSRANSFGARLAQEKLGVPLVSIQLQPVAFRSIHDAPGLPLSNFSGGATRRLTWSMIDAGLGLTITPALNQFRTELGLKRVRRPFRKWIYSPDLVLGLFPEWFGSPQPDWPANTHAVGFPLLNEDGFRKIPQGFEEFLAAGEPPLVFTRGSHDRTSEAYTFFETSIEIARILNRRAILLARERDWIPKTLPENVGYFGYIPLSKVLPRAAAMVHHGGLGTTAHAFAAGIPQIAVPLSDDQPDNAARIERLGAGFRLSAAQYQAPFVAARLDLLLKSEPVRSTCRKLATAMAKQNSLEEACGLIEKTYAG